MTLIPGSPSSRPPPEPAASPQFESEEGSRVGLSESSPSGTLQRTTLPASLLLLALEVPLDGGRRTAARFLVHGLSGLLPDLAVGLRLPLPSAGNHAIALPWIEAAYPLSVREPTLGAPARLFSDLALERVLELEAAGATLHFAHRDCAGPLQSPLGFATAGLEEEFCGLAARTVERCLELTERHARMTIERERLQSRLEHADRLATLGQLTTSVMHELNNPLTSIFAYTESLQRRARARIEAGEDVQDDLTKLDRIAESALRIAQFSDELVDHARPAGDLMARVSLLDVLEKSLSFCEHELRRQGVVLERKLETATPFVRGVSSQLVQIFVNLITNATHAAREGARTIVVHAASDGDGGVVRISDTGPGIAPEHLDRIFEPFFTTKPEGHGTGLGLAIVQELVTRHGGLISVDSTPGSGAMFTVRLPAA